MSKTYNIKIFPSQQNILESANVVLEIAFNQTTCGRNAFLRGKGQKIVGFSYYPPATHNLVHFR